MITGQLPALPAYFGQQISVQLHTGGSITDVFPSDNTLVSAPLEYPVMLPDLQPSIVSGPVAGATLTAGSTVRLVYRVVNQGTAAPRTIDTDPVLLRDSFGGTIATLAYSLGEVLAPGRSYTRQVGHCSCSAECPLLCGWVVGTRADGCVCISLCCCVYICVGVGVACPNEDLCLNIRAKGICRYLVLTRTIVLRTVLKHLGLVCLWEGIMPVHIPHSPTTHCDSAHCRSM